MVAGLIARSEAPAFVPAKPLARGAALSLRDVRHAFALKKAPLPVLDGVSFDVEPGAFVALLGPSGCGKSTLLRLVAGLEPPNEGRIAVDGSALRGPHPSRGLVFQDPTLYPWRSVLGNVAIGPEARGRARAERSRVEEALALVGLSGFADAFPHQLSGGMAQRVALARALVNAPPLLLLDEPLGKLDSLTRLTMQAELVRLWQNKGFTALLVTHDVEEALMLAQRILVFSDRPARIRADISCDRPYPRHREDPGVVADRRTILDLLGIAPGFAEAPTSERMEP